MDNCAFQYLVIKLLTEIRDAVKGGQNSSVSIPDEVISERMDTIEEVNATDEKLVEKTLFVLVRIGGGTVTAITKLVLKHLMTNSCMRQYSLTGKGQCKTRGT